MSGQHKVFQRSVGRERLAAQAMSEGEWPAMQRRLDREDPGYKD